MELIASHSSSGFLNHDVILLFAFTAKGMRVMMSSSVIINRLKLTM